MVDEQRADVVTSISDVTRRMRLLEERYTGIRKNVQVIEQNLVADNKRFFNELKTLTAELTEVRHELAEVKDQMKLIITELRECAKKEEVLVLEKYINLWEPVHFVTRNEVERIVERAIEEKIEKQ